MLDWLRRLLGPPSGLQPSPGVTSAARVPASGSFWARTEGSGLGQGDLLPGCFVPEFPPDFGSAQTSSEVQISTADLIVVTQSCDLENRKVVAVALCPIYVLAIFEQ